MDREFSVYDVLTWLADADLLAAKWLDTASGFQPRCSATRWGSDSVVSRLDEVDRLAFGELLRGTRWGIV